MKVFWQSAYGHLYGLLPEWIRLWRARELESENGCKALETSSHLLRWNAYLSAPLAHMRLLACVYPRMHRQGGSLNKLFTAAGMLANVRTMSTVDALCEDSQHCLCLMSIEQC